MTNYQRDQLSDDECLSETMGPVTGCAVMNRHTTGGPCLAPAKSRHSFGALIIPEICFCKPSCCISAFWEWGTVILDKFGYSITVTTATSSLLGALVFLVFVFANCSSSLWQALCLHTDWCRAEEEGGTTGSEATRVASSQNVHEDTTLHDTISTYMRILF